MLIQILLIIVIASAIVLTWKRARERVIRRREALMWTLLWICAGLIVVWPDVTTRVAAFVGIGRGADLAVYGSVVLLFILVFRLHVAIDKLERTMTNMVRKDALRDLPTAQETGKGESDLELRI